MEKKYLEQIAKKRFGQNFLCDELIIEAIVSAINPCVNDYLVEIGPGLGALTEKICERVDQLTLIELDRDLAKRLRHHPFIRHKLNVIEHDALRFDFNQLFDPLGDHSIKVFGNLPYNISTPLIFHLLSYHNRIDEMYFMLQKEVVNRLSAKPHSKAYGKLTIMAQYYCAITPLLEVPPQAFLPMPKVDSAFVRLKPYKHLPFPCQSVSLLNRVVTHAFNQRRKTLRNSLQGLVNEQEFAQLQIDNTARAENLRLEDFVAITNYLYSKEPC